MMNKVHNLSQSHETPFRGILLAYFILILHVLLILGLGALMIFFRTVINYLPWILAGVGVVIIGSWGLWWYFIKKRGKKLTDALKDPVFQGRTVEVTLFGGLASLKLGQPQGPLAIDYSAPDAPRQLVDPAIARAEEVSKLAQLLKEDLITMDEYLKLKKQIMG